MSLQSVPIDQITESHLQSLLDGGVVEDRHVEYKRDLPGRSEEPKRKFLATVTSFANGAGGDVVIGMDAPDGIPTELCGVGDVDVDQEKLRLHNLMRDRVDPPLHHAVIHSVPLTAGGMAFVIRIHASWQPPHMVKDAWRFYSRNSAGKYPLDVTELRRVFLRSAAAADRIRQFRAHRLGKIVAGETPEPLIEDPKIVLHLMPLMWEELGASIVVDDVSSVFQKLRPMDYGAEFRMNIDGFLGYRRGKAYAQLFRSGIIEVVDASRFVLFGNEQVRYTSGNEFVGALMRCLPMYLEILREVEVSEPYVFFVSLLGVKGCKFYGTPNEAFDRFTSTPFDREDLLLPEVIIEDDWEIKAGLRPILDSLWNAAGYSRCLYYDEAGKWKE